MKVLAALFSSVVVVASVVLAAADPYAPVVTLSVTPPGAQSPGVTIPESACRRSRSATSSKFRANIYDAKPWNNVTCLFKGATATVADTQIAEVELKTGGPAVTSKSTGVQAAGAQGHPAAESGRKVGSGVQVLGTKRVWSF